MHSAIFKRERLRRASTCCARAVVVVRMNLRDITSSENSGAWLEIGATIHRLAICDMLGN